MAKSTFYTVREVAVLLKVHPETVRAWCREETIPGAIRTFGDREWRIPKAVVDSRMQGGGSA